MKTCTVCNKEDLAFQLVCAHCLSRLTTESEDLVENNIALSEVIKQMRKKTEKLEMVNREMIAFLKETRKYSIKVMGGESCWTDEIDQLLLKTIGLVERTEFTRLFDDYNED